MQFFSDNSRLEELRHGKGTVLSPCVSINLIIFSNQLKLKHVLQMTLQTRKTHHKKVFCFNIQAASESIYILIGLIMMLSLFYIAKIVSYRTLHQHKTFISKEGVARFRQLLGIEAFCNIKKPRKTSSRLRLSWETLKPESRTAPFSRLDQRIFILKRHVLETCQAH